jgi:hypothetical protein
MGEDPNASNDLAPVEFLGEMHERIDRLECNTLSETEALPPDIQLFPNPANDRIYWTGKVDWDYIEVFNPNGVLMPINADQLRTNYVQVHNLPAGLYYLLGHKEGEPPIIRKFIKL